MSDKNHSIHLIAVIGAGPAGLYAAQYLARQGMQVILFNRDIKPGGLAEYGIFPDKQKMRKGLRSQFWRILEMTNVFYQGNAVIGQTGDIKLDQLRKAGIQAFMITTGAQKNNWLGLPGEDLNGVYQANDIVFYYNRHPEQKNLQPDFGRNIVIIGVGNVMLDIVHYLMQAGSQHLVTVVGRRGPAEVKFDKPTLVPVAGCLNMDAIRAEVNAALPEIHSVGGDTGDFFALLEEAREKSSGCPSKLDFQIKFMRSPRRILGDGRGHVKAVAFEVNRLRLDNDVVTSYGTGEFETLPAETVIFSIGSRVDEGFGLPVMGENFATSPEPCFPVDGISYEVYNPDLCAHCEDIFVSGWARLASEGVVGLARKDGERGAKALMKYVDRLPPADETAAQSAVEQLLPLGIKAVNLADLRKLRRVEQKIAAREGLPEFKFDTKEAMLRVITGD